MGVAGASSPVVVFWLRDWKSRPRLLVEEFVEVEGEVGEEGPGGEVDGGGVFREGEGADFDGVVGFLRVCGVVLVVVVVGLGVDVEFVGGGRAIEGELEEVGDAIREGGFF